MGQVRHESATTTHAVRAAIQRSQASLATLSRELGINPHTGDVAQEGGLCEAEEAMIVGFRRYRGPAML